MQKYTAVAFALSGGVQKIPQSCLCTQGRARHALFMPCCGATVGRFLRHFHGLTPQSKLRSRVAIIIQKLWSFRVVRFFTFYPEVLTF